MGTHARVTQRSTLWKKVSGSLAAWAMVVTMLAGVGFFNAEKSDAAEWPHKDQPGTVQGYTFENKTGTIEKFDSGDKAIPGVVMNAELVKKDGRLITGRNAQRQPVPLQVTSDDNGFYSFNFRPLLQKVYGPHARASQLKISRHDRIRVWPDESNYQPGGALDGFTPVRLNGGARFTEVTSQMQSWLGRINYSQGAISHMNMSFRPETGFENTAANRDNGSHLPEKDWQPTTKHHIAFEADPSNQPNTLKDDGFLCGYVYSDTTAPFDSWNDGGTKDTADTANATPDRVVAGARVVMTTYDQTRNEKPTKPKVTRYSYTDKHGRYCIAFDGTAQEIQGNTGNPAQMMVTVEPLRPDSDMTDAEKRKFQTEFTTITNQSPETGQDFDGITWDNLLRRDANNMPIGYASYGNNGWQGQIRMAGVTDFRYRSVGYNTHDKTCGKRVGYCLPTMRWWEKDGQFAADGAELGLIPAQMNLTLDRYSHEYNRTTPTTVTITLNNVTATNPINQVVMVPVGADPTDKSSWVATSQKIDNLSGTTETGSITIPSDVPQGDYTMYVYSWNREGTAIDTAMFQDVAYYRIGNASGHYYTDKSTRDAAYDGLANGATPQPSVTTVTPGTTLWATYSDLPENNVNQGQTGKNKVYLTPKGVGHTSPDALLKDDNLQMDVGEVDPAVSSDIKAWDLGRAKNVFTVDNTMEPGDWDIVLVNSYGEEVDRTPLKITGPILSATPEAIDLGATATVSATDLNPNTKYKVQLITRDRTTRVVADNITPPANGKWSKAYTIPSDIEPHVTGRATFILTKMDDPENDNVLSTVTVSVGLTGQGPQIILPGKQAEYTDLDDYVGNGYQAGMLGGTSAISAGTRVFYVNPRKDTRLAIHAIDRNPTGVNGTQPFLAKYVPGGAQPSQADGTWQILEDTYWNEDMTAQLPNERQPMHWDEIPSVLFRDSPGWRQSGRKQVVTIKFTSKVTGLSDQKTFVLWNDEPQGQNNYGVTNQMGPQQNKQTWSSTAAWLTRGVPIPDDTYCMLPGPDGKGIQIWRQAWGTTNTNYNTAKPYYKPDDTRVPENVKHHWPEGVTLKESSEGQWQWCLSGTPTSLTPDEDWYDYFADAYGVDDWKRRRWWSQSSGDEGPLTVRIRVREDDEPPVISAMANGNAINDKDTIVAHEGEKLPLRVSVTDNASLKVDGGFVVHSSTITPITPETTLQHTVFNERHNEAVVDYKDLDQITNSIGSYAIVYKAVDIAGNTSTFTVNIDVKKAPLPPVFDTDATPTAGEAGVSYRWQIPVTDPDKDVPGHPQPFGISNVTVTDGALPQGLHLTPARDDDGDLVYVVAGRPTESGNFDVTFEAEDHEGETTSHSYTFRIAKATAPRWDNAPATGGYTFEAGEAIGNGDEADHQPITVSATCNGGRGVPAEITFHNKNTTADTTYSNLPAGLHATPFDHDDSAATPDVTQISGAAQTVNYNHTTNRPTDADEGVTYVAVATCPAYDGPADKQFDIRIKDTTKPQITDLDQVSFKKTEPIAVDIEAYDNSNDQLSFSNATCTSLTDGDPITLVPDKPEGLNGTTLMKTTVPHDLGVYQCSFSVTDKMGNRSEDTFKLTVRDDGPLLIVSPEEQTVTTYGAPTPIQTIRIYSPDASSVSGWQKCVNDLGEGAHYNADKKWITGNVSAVHDRSVTCQFTATDDAGKSSTAKAVVHIKGPVKGPWNDGKEKFVIDGMVDDPITYNPAFSIEKNGTLTLPADQKADMEKLFGYSNKPFDFSFADGQGTFTGTPSEDGSHVIYLDARIPRDQFDPARDSDITFKVPVLFIIKAKPEYQNVPASANSGRTITPSMRVTELGKTYTMWLCQQDADGAITPECLAGTTTDTDKIEVNGTNNFTVPTADMGTVFEVVVKDNAGRRWSGQSPTITVGRVWIEMQNPMYDPTDPTSKPIVEMWQELPGIGGMEVKGTFRTFDKDHTYTVYMCEDEYWDDDTDTCANVVVHTEDGKEVVKSPMYVRYRVKEGTTQEVIDEQGYPFMLPNVRKVPEGAHYNPNRYHLYAADDAAPDKTVYVRHINVGAMNPAPYTPGQGGKPATGSDLTLTVTEGGTQPYHDTLVKASAVLKDQFGNLYRNKPVTIVTQNGKTFHKVMTDEDGAVTYEAAQVGYQAGMPGEKECAQLYYGTYSSSQALSQALKNKDTVELDKECLTPQKNPDKVNEPVIDGDNPSTVTITTGTKSAVGSLAAAGNDPAKKHLVTVTLKNVYGDVIDFDDVDKDKLAITTYSDSGTSPYQFSGDNPTAFVSAWKAAEGQEAASPDAPAKTVVEVASRLAGVAHFKVTYDGKEITVENVSPPTTVLSGAFSAADAAKDADDSVSPNDDGLCEDGKAPSYIETEDDNAIANGTATNQLTVVLRDAFCNPISGKASDIRTTESPDGLTWTPADTTWTARLGSPGEYFAKATSTKATTFDVTLSAPLQANTVQTTFVADSVDVSHSSFTIEGSPSDVGQQQTVHLYLKDRNNNPVSISDFHNLTWVWEKPNGDDVTLGVNNFVWDKSSISEVPADKGHYMMKVTSYKAGTGALSSINYSTLGAISSDAGTNKATFTALDEPAIHADDSVSPGDDGLCEDGKAPSYMETTGPNTADGTTANKLTVMVRDKYCNALTGKTVTAPAVNNLLTSANGTSGVLRFSDNNDGTYTKDVYSTNAGTYAVALDSPAGLALSVNTEFVAGTVDAQSTTLSVFADNEGEAGDPVRSITAGDTVHLQLVPKDATGNAVSEGLPQQMTVAIPGANPKVRLTWDSQAAMYKGTATPTKAAPAIAPPQQNFVSVETAPLKGKRATLDIVPGPAVKAPLESGQPQIQGTEGIEIPTPGNVIVMDRYNNPLRAGQNVWIAVPNNSGEPIVPTRVNIKEGGKATIPAFTPDSGDGQKVQIFADVAGQAGPTSIKDIPVSVAVGDPSIANSTLDVTPRVQFGSTGRAQEHTMVDFSGTVKSREGSAIEKSDNLTAVIDNGGPTPIKIELKTDENGTLVARNAGQKMEFEAGEVGTINKVTIYFKDFGEGEFPTDADVAFMAKSIASDQNTAEVNKPVWDGDKPSVVTITSGTKKVGNRDDLDNSDFVHMVTAEFFNKYGDAITYDDVPQEVKTKLAIVLDDSASDYVLDKNVFTTPFVKADAVEAGAAYPANAKVTTSLPGTLKLKVTYDGTNFMAVKDNTTSNVLNAAFERGTEPYSGTGVTCDDGKHPSYLEVGTPGMVGDDGVIVTLMLRDKFCEPIDVPKSAVTMTATPQAADLSWHDWKQGRNAEGQLTGIYTTTLKATKVSTVKGGGGYTVSATVKPNQEPHLLTTDTKAQFDWTFADIAKEHDGDAKYWVTDGTRKADGVDHHTITVYLQDDYGNPITGTNIAVKKPGTTYPTTAGMDMTKYLTAYVNSAKSEPTSMTVTKPQRFTDAGVENGFGKYTMDITSTKAGKASMTVNYKVSVDGSVLVNKDVRADKVGDARADLAEFVAGEPVVDGQCPDGKPTSYMTATTGATADGNATNRVTVVLRDEFCNPVEFGASKVTMRKVEGVTFTPAAKIGAGVYAFDATSTVATTYDNLTTALPLAVSTDDAGQSVKMTFVADKFNADASRLWVYTKESWEHDPAHPEKPANDTITAGEEIVIVLDPNDAKGNAVNIGDSIDATVPGMDNKVTLTRRDSDGLYIGIAQKVQGTEDKDVVPTKATPGPVSDVTLPATSVVSSLTAKLIVQPDSAYRAVPQSSMINAIPGEKVPGDFTWNVYDKYGNPIWSDQMVWFAHPDDQSQEATGDLVPVAGGVSPANNDGVVVMPQFDAKAWMNNMPVQVHSSPDITKTPIGSAVLNTNNSGDPDGQRTTVTATPTTPVEGTQVTIGGHLKDMHGNNVKRQKDLVIRIVDTTNPNDYKVIQSVRMLTDSNGSYKTRDEGNNLTFEAGAFRTKQQVQVFLTDGTIEPNATPFAYVDVIPQKNPSEEDVPVIDADDATTIEKSWASIDKDTTLDPMADGSQQYTITAHLVNKYGEPVTLGAPSNRWMRVELDDNYAADNAGYVMGDNLSVGVFSSQGEGQYTAHVKTTKAGTPKFMVVVKNYHSARSDSRTISDDPIFLTPVTRDGDQIQRRDPATLPAKFRAGPPSDQSIVQIVDESGVPLSSATAGQSVDIVYTPKDASGNLTAIPAGQQIVVKIPRPDGTLRDVALRAKGDGTYTGTTTLPKAGSYRAASEIQNTEGTKVSTGPQSNQVSVTSGEPAKAYVDVTTNPHPGGTIRPQIVVKDDYGNKVDPGMAVKLHVEGGQSVDGVTGDDGVVYQPKAGDPSTADTAKPAVTTLDKGGKQTLVVTSSDGQTTIGQRAFNVKPKPPVIANANATMLRGTVEGNVAAGSTVTIYKDGQKIGTATVGEGGAWQFAYSAGSYEPQVDDELKADVTDKVTALTSKKSLAANPNLSAPDGVTIDLNKDEPAVVSGDGVSDPNDTVKVCVVKKGTSDPVCKDATITPGEGHEPGTYTTTVDEDLDDGDTVIVKVIDDETGNETVTEKVVDFTPPEPPTVKAQGVADDGSVTVTIHPDNKEDVAGAPVITIIKGDTVMSLAQFDPEITLVGPDARDGSYSIVIPVKDRGDAVTVNATFADEAGNMSDPGSDVVAAKDAPDITDAKANATAVEGKVNAAVPVDSTVTVSDRDTGTTIMSGKVSDQGCQGAARCFAIEWPSAWPDGVAELKDLQAVSVAVTDKDTGKTVTVVLDVDVVIPTLDVNPTNGSTVTGTVDDPDATVTVTYEDENGKTHKIGPVAPTCDGEAGSESGEAGGSGGDAGSGGQATSCTFSIDLPNGTDPDDPKVDLTKPITVVAEDPSGNVEKKVASVDTTDPVVTLKPTKGDVIKGSVADDNLPDNPTVVIRYIYEDNGHQKTIDNVALTCSDGGTACTFSQALSPAAMDGTAITVTAVDKAGNSTTASETADSTKPGTPNVSVGQGRKGDTIVVTGESGATPAVTYTNKAGDDVECTPVVEDPAGTYKCTLSEDAKNGTYVSATLTDAAGNTSDGGRVKVDRGKPSLNVDPTNGTKVSGTSDEGADVTITYHDSDGGTHVLGPVKPTCTQTSGKECRFDVTMPDGSDPSKPAPDLSKPITVAVEKDDAVTQKVITADTRGPGVPANIKTPDSRTITGSIDTPVDVGTTVRVTLPDDSVISAVVDQVKGTFIAKVPAGKAALKDGDPLTIVAQDPAGNTERVDATADVDNRVSAQIDENGTQVDGVTDARATVWLHDSEGRRIAGPVTAGSDGTFVIAVPDEFKPIPGEQFSVRSTDPAGHVATQVVTYNPTPPAAPTIDEVTKDGKVNGSTPEGTKVRVCVMRVRAVEPDCVDAEADEQGGYSVDIPGGPLGPGDKLSVVAVDVVTGAVSDRATFVQPEGKVTTKPVIPLSKTGAQAGGVLLLAVALVFAGAGALVVGRRARRP